MKSETISKTKSDRLTKYMAYVAGLIIALLPFHAFLTVWGSQLIGHYTLLRLWKEFLLLGLVGASLVLILRAGHLSARLQALRRRPVVILTAVYVGLIVASAAVTYLAGGVTLHAAAYGSLIDSRFLIFFLVTWLIGRHTPWLADHWRRLVLVPAALVVVFGILQFTVLPLNFLSHFGYGAKTIPFLQTVDQKVSYQRVQSTLRGANPLGAYLILIIAAAGGWLLRARPDSRVGSTLPALTSRQSVWTGGLLLASVAALLLTFSRSAWIGVTAASLWLLWRSIRSAKARHGLLLVGCGLIVIAGSTGLALRHNDFFQNTIFHHDEHSAAAGGSDQGHLAATRSGLHDIVHQPLGAGTGTAGPASTYNQADGRAPRIAEDYFIQIGQEVGWLGLGLFIAINLLVAQGLWRRRDQLLPQVLLASLIGITIVNLLSHAWADDTLCYIWWGLAGTAWALPERRRIGHV